MIFNISFHSNDLGVSILTVIFGVTINSSVTMVPATKLALGLKQSNRPKSIF